MASSGYKFPGQAPWY